MFLCKGNIRVFSYFSKQAQGNITFIRPVGDNNYNLRKTVTQDFEMKETPEPQLGYSGAQ